VELANIHIVQSQTTVTLCLYSISTRDPSADQVMCLDVFLEGALWKTSFCRPRSC
jgi:hypothetical protein